MARLSGDRLIKEAKIVDYLLNSRHPIGASKAKFFARLGFSSSNPDALVDALSEHPAVNEVIFVETSRYGIKSGVECSFATPDGRNPCIRTVWMLDEGNSIQRFVTAYPARP